MPNILQPTRLRSDLRVIYGDGVGFSLMVGLGETYVSAFALALGLGEVAAGWIVAVPLLLGAVLQLISPWAVARLGSHRRWVVICASGQAACCVGYLLLAVITRAPPILAFLVATLYWASGMAGGPAWNTWVGRILALILMARLSRVAFQPAPMVTRVLGVRPNTGSLDAPLVSSLEAGREEATGAGKTTIAAR